MSTKTEPCLLSYITIICKVLTWISPSHKKFNLNSIDLATLLNLFQLLSLATLCEICVNKPPKAKMEQSTAAKSYIICCVKNPQIHFPALLGQDEKAHMVRKATCCWEISAFPLHREEQFSLITHSLLLIWHKSNARDRAWMWISEKIQFPVSCG